MTGRRRAWNEPREGSRRPLPRGREGAAPDAASKHDWGLDDPYAAPPGPASYGAGDELTRDGRIGRGRNGRRSAPAEPDEAPGGAYGARSDSGVLAPASGDDDRWSAYGAGPAPYAPDEVPPPAVTAPRRSWFGRGRRSPAAQPTGASERPEIAGAAEPREDVTARRRIGIGRGERGGGTATRSPGEILRSARLRRRISLTEAEKATRIRQRYLQALEDDDYGALPAGVYSVGFLRNYAIYLGVPPEEVLASGDGRRPRRDRQIGVQSVAPPIQLSAPRATWLLAAGGVVVVLLLALAWLGLSDSGQSAAQPSAAGAVSSSGTPAAAGSPTALSGLAPLATAVPPTVPPATPAPTAAPTSTANPRQVEVELRTVDRSWVRATVDGDVVLEETLAAGQTKRWVGTRTISLRVGNGAGVDVTVNGQRVGALGPAGQPVDRDFSRPT